MNKHETEQIKWANKGNSAQSIPFCMDFGTKASEITVGREREEKKTEVNNENE